MRTLLFVLCCLASAPSAQAQTPTTDVQAALARLRPTDTLRFWSMKPDYVGRRAVIVRIAGDTLVVRHQSKDVEASAIHSSAFGRIDIGHRKVPNEGHVFGSGGKGLLKGFLIGAGAGALIGAVVPGSKYDRGD